MRLQGGLILSTTQCVDGTDLLVAFVGVVGITRYVSLGSLLVVIIYLVEVVVYGQMGGFHVAQNYLYEMYGIAAFLMLSAFFKHRENIKRLLTGTEN